MQTLGAHPTNVGLVESPSTDLGGVQSKRNKRFQACIACRASKSRCLASKKPNTCQLCLRSGRECVMPGPAKPRMKSAQKFSELEKKINLLSDALAAKEKGSNNDVTAELDPKTAPIALTSVTANNDTSSDNCANTNLLRIQASSSRLDVLDEGIVDLEVASNLFNHWNTNMRYLIPLLLQPDLSFDQARTTQPVIFLTILTIASSSIWPRLSAQLVTRLTHEFGQQIFVQNRQNTDIILATLLFSQYFYEPGNSTNIAPSKYTYAATAMSSDLGLRSMAKTVLAKPSDSGMEAARICLSEWYATSIAAVLLHRNPFVRHTPELEKYAAIVQSEQQSSHRWVFRLIKLQQILESASLLLDTSEIKSETAFDDPTTQYKLNMLQKQLSAWDAEQVDDVDKRIKQHAINIAYLHIHEIAVRCFIRKMKVQKQSRDQGTSGPEDGLMGLTPLHFDCLTKCLAAIKAAFDIYLSFELPFARYLPNSYLFWNMTIAVILIKLGHFGEAVSKFGEPAWKHIPAGGHTDFKSTLVYYLDAIAAKMDQVSQDGYMPQAKPYVTVLRKLKPYYLQKRAVCINPHNDQLVEDPDERQTNMTGQDVHTANYPRPEYATSMSQDLRARSQNLSARDQYSSYQAHQPPSSRGDLGQNIWTPSTGDFAQRPFPTPPSSASFGDRFDSPTTSTNAAYEPHTYANTDWAGLILDQDAIEQLDSFMFAEEDTAWMQSLL